MVNILLKNKIMTAEEFIKDKYNVKSSSEVALGGLLLTEELVEFARYHVQEALKSVLEDSPTGSSTDILSYEDMKDAILNAYPLEKIK